MILVPFWRFNRSSLFCFEDLSAVSVLLAENHLDSEVRQIVSNIARRAELAQPIFENDYRQSCSLANSARRNNRRTPWTRSRSSASSEGSVDPDQYGKLRVHHWTKGSHGMLLSLYVFFNKTYQNRIFIFSYIVLVWFWKSLLNGLVCRPVKRGSASADGRFCREVGVPAARSDVSG